MAAPTRVTSGSTILINDLNQLIDLFEGAASMTEAFKFVSSAGENFIVKLSDAAGVRKFSIQDSAGVEVAYINSDGSLVISGSFTPTGALMLPASAAPADTTDASIQWDSDDNRIVVGDGAATKTFYSGDWATTQMQYKYRTATLDLTTTTYADVAASSGNVAFSVAASTAYRLHLLVSLSAMGTQNSGGLKLELSGPASPTQISIMSKIPYYVAQPNDVGTNAEFPILSRRHRLEGSSSAFGGIIAENNVATPAGGSAAGATTGLWEFDIMIVNGANAGTVTLRAAQNTAAGTTTIDEITAFLSPLVAG